MNSTACCSGAHRSSSHASGRPGRSGARWARHAAVALLAALVSVARAQLVEDYRFKGRVLDPAGQPLAGVHITLRNVETGSRIVFTSHDDGTFDRRMIPHALYEGIFEKPGYVRRTENFDWSASPKDVITVEAKIVLESQVEKAKRELGKKAAALYEEGYAALAANDCVRARQKAEELLALGAGSYEYAVRFVRARCYAQQEQWDDAVRAYREVLALRPELFEARFDLALVLEKQGQHEAALQEYEQAATLRPENVEVQYNMGAILFQQKAFDRARPHLEQAAALDSTHAPAAKALGFVYLQGEKKDVVAAQRYLERYLALEPQAPDAAQIREILAAIAASPR